MARWCDPLWPHGQGPAPAAPVAGQDWASRRPRPAPEGFALWTPFPAALALTLRALSSKRKGDGFVVRSLATNAATYAAHKTQSRSLAPDLARIQPRTVRLPMEQRHHRLTRRGRSLADIWPKNGWSAAGGETSVPARGSLARSALAPGPGPRQTASPSGLPARSRSPLRYALFPTSGKEMGLLFARRKCGDRLTLSPPLASQALSAPRTRTLQCGTNARTAFAVPAGPDDASGSG